MEQQELYKAWLELGERRTLALLADATGVSVHKLKRLSSKHGWVKRLKKKKPTDTDGHKTDTARTGTDTPTIPEVVKAVIPAVRRTKNARKRIQEPTVEEAPTIKPSTGKQPLMTDEAGLRKVMFGSKNRDGEIVVKLKDLEDELVDKGTRIAIKAMEALEKLERKVRYRRPQAKPYLRPGKIGKPKLPGQPDTLADYGYTPEESCPHYSAKGQEPEKIKKRFP